MGILQAYIQGVGRGRWGGEGRKRQREKVSVRKPRKSKEGLQMVATNVDGKGAVIVE